MSKKVGNIAHDYDENGLVISSETRQLIEDETRLLVDAAYKRAKDLIRKHEKDLHSLASQLLKHETLSGNQICKMLNLPPQKGMQEGGKPAKGSGSDSNGSKKGKATATVSSI